MVVVLLALIAYISCWTADSVVTVAEIPNLNLNDQIQFYYLEAAFPYNAPQSIK
jgi:hypothetical protein